MSEEEGWVSYESKLKNARKAFAFNVDKQTDKPVRYITVFLPIENAQKALEIKAAFQKDYSENELLVSLKIGKQSYKLNYQL